MKRFPFIFLFFIFSVFSLSYWGYRQYQNSSSSKKEAVKSQYEIRLLLQSSEGRDQLTTKHLASLMGLSLEQSQNLYLFQVGEVEERLLLSPWIREAQITRVPPHAIHVQYRLREPIPLLEELPFLAMDEEGYIFPVESIFSPKRLPRLFFGFTEEEKTLLREEAPHQRSTLHRRREESAFVRKFLQECNGIENDLRVHFPVEDSSIQVNFPLVKIDLSLFAGERGSKEVRVALQQRTVKEKNRIPHILLSPKIVRLSSTHYLSNFTQYMRLCVDKAISENIEDSIDASQEESKNFTKQGELLQGVAVEKEQWVDLRLPHTAFLQKTPL